VILRRGYRVNIIGLDAKKPAHGGPSVVVAWIVQVLSSFQTLVFSFACALFCVATVAHGLEWTMPKVTAFRYWFDVIHHMSELPAFDAHRIFAQPCRSQCSPHLAAVSLITIDSLAWLALVCPWAAPISFGNVCHLHIVLSLGISDEPLAGLSRFRML
jgi:hypothetical protein